MTRKETITQKLLQGLIYPSVLGTFVYEIVIRISQLIENDLSDFKPHKFLLVFAFVAFYCCDYLYSTLLKEYKLSNMLLHICTVLLLCIEFISIHLTKAESKVDVEIILFCMIIFLSLFLAYDIYLSKNKTDNNEKSFFKDLAIWELGGLILLVVLLFISKYIDNLLMSYFIGVIMLVETAVYSSYLSKRFKMEV